MHNVLKSMMLAALAAAALLTGPASAQYVGGNLQLDLDERGDVSIAGANVRLTGRVGGSVSVASADFFTSADIGGDLEMAAANVTVSGPVHGDVSGFAANITLDAPVGGDFSAAGANITLLSLVAGEMNARGALITIGREAGVSGEADLAGREIIIDGALGRGGKLSARDVRINGTVNGPLEIAGQDITIAASARIEGPVTVRAPNRPRVAEGAVMGELTYIEAPFIEDRRTRRNVSLSFLPSTTALSGVFAASAFVIGVFVSILAPRGVASVALQFRRRPLASGFVGLVAFALGLVGAFALILLLSITILGIPIAILLVLSLPIILFLAYAFGGVVLGDRLLNRRGGPAGLGLRVVSLFAALIVVLALSVIPGIGWIFPTIMFFIGLGAWTLAIFGRESLKGLESGSADAADAV